jgi:hypothetical protein
MMSAWLPPHATADVLSTAAAISGVDMVNAYRAGAATVQLSEIDGPTRDLRLDACRGLALWFMFVDHIPHNVVSWLTLRNYGFSDATEVFVFVSGYTCMVAYGDVLRRQGWLAAMVHAVRRGCQIYIAFLILLVAYLVLVEALGGGAYLDATNTAVFFEHPATAIVRASMMQYTPVNTDVLPIFVLFHLTFPVLLWSFARNTGVALTLSALLYLSVQIFGFNLPAWPRGEWFFNPLAWQMLFVFGMWAAKPDSVKLWTWARSRAALIFSILYLVFGLVVALSWQIKALDGLLPGVLSKLIYPIDKTNLDPLRFLHFLSLAVVAIHLAPRNRRAWSSPWGTGIVRCGENSLAIFCLSVLLSLMASAALDATGSAIPMQITVSLSGIAIMITAATLLTFASRLGGHGSRLF